jgi:hypothetical protein
MSAHPVAHRNDIRGVPRPQLSVFGEGGVKSGDPSPDEHTVLVLVPQAACLGHGRNVKDRGHGVCHPLGAWVWPHGSWGGLVQSVGRL